MKNNNTRKVYNTISFIIDELYKGNAKPAYTMRQDINNEILRLFNEVSLSNDDIEIIGMILTICNITYNNIDKSFLPVEDGIYDMLIEKYRKYNNDVYPVGSIDIKFDTSNIGNVNKSGHTDAFTLLKDDELEFIDDMLFRDSLYQDMKFTPMNFINHAFTIEEPYIDKRIRDTTHNHPDLVGTFDKVKYVLNSQARAHGVYDDDNVRILERDFFKPLIDKGIMNVLKPYTMILSLKYDGVSVEADCSTHVISARSRGDAVEGKASDYTPLLQGYQFPNNFYDVSHGIKFEAIINRFNLEKLNSLGMQYINPRTAIIGITGSSDGYKYRDYISMIPIATDIKINGEPLDRLVELEFLNTYYAKDDIIRYQVITGDYNSLLFQIKRFVEEAEFSKDKLPFMYDGVVLEFYNPEIKSVLGRDNAIDRYKCGIKFNPEKKLTTFRGYTYEVGQNGSVTPMIHYDPIEFMGSIHNHSSGHSYGRFKELNLRLGDIIEVGYVNDVMPYVYKYDCEDNIINRSKIEPIRFIDTCPGCGEKLEISDSGLSVYCNNMSCPLIEIQRVANMLAKLGIINFSKSTVEKFSYRSLKEYMEATVDDFSILGPNDSINLYNQLQNIKNNYILFDYELLGSLGFTGIAKKTWKTILSEVSIKTIIGIYCNTRYENEMFMKLKNLLGHINGIGDNTLYTIAYSLEYFMDDLSYINNHIRYKSIKDHKITGKIIRFTGIRDAGLCIELNQLGHDANDSGVTKATDYLVVPYEGYYSGSKYKKATKYNIPVVSIDWIRSNKNNL